MVELAAGRDVENAAGGGSRSHRVTSRTIGMRARPSRFLPAPAAMIRRSSAARSAGEAWLGVQRRPVCRYREMTWAGPLRAADPAQSLSGRGGQQFGGGETTGRPGLVGRLTAYV